MRVFCILGCLSHSSLQNKHEIGMTEYTPTVRKVPNIPMNVDVSSESIELMRRCFHSASNVRDATKRVFNLTESNKNNPTQMCGVSSLATLLNVLKKYFSILSTSLIFLQQPQFHQLIEEQPAIQL